MKFQKLNALVLLVFLCTYGANLFAQGLTKKTWPAGTIVGKIGQSRMHNYHRGYIYSTAATDLENDKGNSASYVWDISDPENPKQLFKGKGNNGHHWIKMGDLFWSTTSGSEISRFKKEKDNSFFYLDLSGLPNPGQWTRDAGMLIDRGPDWMNVREKLETFPYVYKGKEVWDRRNMQKLADWNPHDYQNVQQDKTILLGNLLIMTPDAEMAVFDVSEPSKPRLLDEYIGDISQYVAVPHFWRNNIVVLPGLMTESGNRAPALLDFSDPTQVRLEQYHPEVPGRYAHFQDEYIFTSSPRYMLKFNLETGKEELRIERQKDEFGSFGDFQNVPLGHMVLAAGGQIASHQDTLDVTPPSVGYHLPRSQAKNRSIHTIVGLVINETLDDITVNDNNIQIIPSGGDPVETQIIRYSWDVINIVPTSPLKPNTSYQVKLVEGGVKDVSGNGIKAYSFEFQTGAADLYKHAPEIKKIELVESANPVLTGTEAKICADAIHPTGGELWYRWDVNEGGEPEQWQKASGSEIRQCLNHTFSQKGATLVEFKVKNDLEQAVSQSIPVNVYNPVAGRPTQASPIIVDDQKRHVWVVNPDNNSVSIVHADDLVLNKEIKTGKNPTSVALDNTGNAWITCRKDDALVIINGNDFSTERRIYLGRGSAPVSIVMDPEKEFAYVAAYGTGEVLKFSVSSRQKVDGLSVGPTPKPLAVSPTGDKLMVGRFISPDTAGLVHEIDLASFQKSRTIELIVDSETADDDAAARGLPNYVSSLAYHPDGATVYYAAKKDNILRGKKRDGQELTFETTVRSMVGELDLEKGKEDLRSRFDIDNSSQPSALLFTPYGSHAFLTLQGNDSLVAVNPKVRAGVKIGKAPQGIALDRVTERLFTRDFMGRTVTVLDAAEFIRHGSGDLVVIDTVSTVTDENLTNIVLRGKQIFYSADSLMSLEGYISCALCHLDGGHDGRTWDFTNRGEGLRNTITLHGRAGTEHGPLHWSANFDEVQDFENDIRLHFSGQGLLTESYWGQTQNTLGDKKSGLSEDLDALAAYVASLDQVPPSPHRNEDGTMTSEARAGEEIFLRNDVGCAECHIPPKFTDSDLGAISSGNPTLHNVGTIDNNAGKRMGGLLKGFDTPTLLGIWETGPYLHDGSANTLMDVITTRNPDDKHGKTSHLSDSEKDQLVSFLMQLDHGEDTRSNAVPQISKLSRNPGLLHKKMGNFYVFRVSGLALNDDFRLSLWDGAGKQLRSWGARDFVYSPENSFYTLRWENSEQSRSKIAPGLYFLNLRGSSFNQSGKFVLEP